MDNIGTAEPAVIGDATLSQDNSDINTQPEGTGDSISGGQSGNEGQASKPWDNDPKFKGKSDADIYNAYQEIEKSNGHLSQKAQFANMIEEKYGLTPEQFKAQLDETERLHQEKRYAENPLAPIYDEVQSLRQTVERQEAEKAYATEEKQLDEFLSANPEYAPFKDKIFKLGLTTEQDKDYADIATEWFGQSRAQGQQDAYKKIDTKIMTQATGASMNAPRGKPTPEEMDKMSAAELEAILPHADTSNRPY
jgi:hypothetical protein